MIALAIGVALVSLTVLAVELGARGWIRARRAYYVFPPGLRLRLHLDRDAFPELEPVVRFEVNRNGERGGDVPRVAPGAMVYRVLVAGGSQPEGYLLDQDSSWPGALQRLMNTPEHRRRLSASATHVGSIARSGIGAEALDRLLARALPRYPRLSAIVILVGASDVLRWLEEGAPFDAPSTAVPDADLFRCHPEGPFGWTPSRLAVVELVRRARRRWLRPVEVHHHAGRWIERARRMRASAKVIRATMPNPAMMLDHFETHFRRVIERAQAHADRVVVVRQSWLGKDGWTPDELAHMWHGGVGQAWREDVSTYFSIEVTAKLMAMLDARAEQVASAVGVEQIDLMALVEPSLANYYDFFHLTPAGAAIVASAVARVLLQEREPARCVDLRAS